MASTEFETREGQKVLLLSKTSRRPVEFTQLALHCVLRIPFSGGEAGGAVASPLTTT
jgi:hypothetical protein